MKKLLIPIVALLAFSVLCTSASANMPYCMASFYGEAEGCCWVFEAPPGDPPLYPDASGKGSFHISGLAIARWEPIFQAYWTYKPNDGNTRLWTRRTRMTVSWGSEKLMIYMWPSYITYGMFDDTMDTFSIANMSLFGYYKGEALQFIWGNATLVVGKLGPSGESAAAVVLVTGTGHFRTFIWVGEETEILPPGCIARCVIHSVTVWGPIPWHPTNSIL